MIKKDLKRAGIPYQTEEGTTDSRAVGRHTHITELLRNGVSLVEALELARHSGIRMTIRYTHIGLDDQARAVAAISTPRTSINAKKNPGSILGVKPAANPVICRHQLATR